MKAQIFNASAGAGKTYRLAYKYVREVIQTPTLYRNILAVTFTNKATEEMKSRILAQINTIAAGRESQYMDDLRRELPQFSEEKIRRNATIAQNLILHDYSRFTILTIDKFFQRLLRAFIQEIGIDIGYNLEIESSSIIEQSVDRLIELSQGDKKLQRWLQEYAQERVSEGKKWDIRDGIKSLANELFKEEVRESLEKPISKSAIRSNISERERSCANLRDELQKMGAEALQIISQAGLSCDDFKNKKRSVAQLFRHVAEGEIPEVKTSHQNSTQSDDVWYGKQTTQAVVDITPTLRATMESLIEAIQVTKSAVNTLTLMRENYRSFALLSDLNAIAQSLCDEQNTMLLNQTSRLIKEFISESDAPFIYEKVGNRFSHFMIDEFQDTSRQEWENFLPLLHNAISESDEQQQPILIVGDIKQSIYRWRGGDWRILHSDALNALGRESAQVINLVDNYRSLPLIVKFNNEMIERVVESVNSDMNEALERAITINTKLKTSLTDTIKEAYEGHHQTPKRSCENDGFVEIVKYEERLPLVELICDTIDRGFKPCEIMILTRTNPQAAKVAQMLLTAECRAEERYRFDIMTQEALSVGYAPVSQFIIAIFRLAINPKESLQLALYNNFLGRTVDTPLPSSEVSFLNALRLFNPIEAFEMLCERYALERNSSNIAYIQAIHEQVISFCNNRIGDISLFVKWWEESGESKSLNVERSEHTIEILTLHKAKGLEKKVVIIPYCDWRMTPLSNGKRQSIIWAKGDERGKEGEAKGAEGAEILSSTKLPIAYKKDMATSEFADDYYEEMLYSHIDSINMLYVALTRAVESLHIMVPVKSNAKGNQSATGIGGVILKALATTSMSHNVVEESTTEEERVTRYQFGILASPVKGKEQEMRQPYFMRRYPSNSDVPLRLKMPTQRYNQSAEYAPREMGILMHKAFERAYTVEDIFKSVETMRTNSQINESEYAELHRAVSESLESPLVKEWFSAKWDKIRNECEIIQGDGGTNRRPDRVMIKDRRCVVVDYKFGTHQPKIYERQMRQYIELLQRMGYEDVKGYLWYIRQGEICEVR